MSEEAGFCKVSDPDKGMLQLACLHVTPMERFAQCRATQRHRTMAVTNRCLSVKFCVPASRICSRVSNGINSLLVQNTIG